VFTFAELEERTNRLAHALADRGVGPGDKVGVYGYNTNEWVEAQWAAWKLRAVPVNVNYRYVEGELRYLFDNADMVAWCTARSSAAHRRGARRLPAPDDLRRVRRRLGHRHLGRATPSLRRGAGAASPERGFGPAATTTCTCSTPAAPPGCRRV
jgi:3-oxocholest-4-en-26-oate---CoA ligase